MTNQQTPREAIAKAIHAYTEVEPFRREWDSLHWADRNTYQGQADAVIAHLWRRGTDWGTTVVKVACILEGEVRCDVHPESYHSKLEEMADEIVATLLTALIGDRPEQEAE